MSSNMLLSMLLSVAVSSVAVYAQTCTPAATVLQDNDLTALVGVATSLVGYEPAAVLVTPVLADAPTDPQYTIFAPVDAAFEASPGLASADQEAVFETITGHVVEGVYPSSAVVSASAAVYVETLAGNYLELVANGTTVTVGVYGSEAPSATVVEADLAACSGVIHIVDQLLQPAPCESVVDAIARTPMLSMLYEAAGEYLSSEDLEALSDPTANLTVLAPVDAAFEEIESVLPTISPAAIADILLLHVVPATAFSTDLADGTMLPTLLEGETLDVMIAGGNVTFAPTGSDTVATVVRANAPACSPSGAIHWIDTVMLPPGGLAPAPASTIPATAPGTTTRDLPAEGPAEEQATTSSGLGLKGVFMALCAVAASAALVA